MSVNSSSLRCSLLLIFLSGLASLSGQEVVNTATFFQLFSAEPTGVGLVLNTNGPVKVSWMDKLELRTETRDFDPDQQEYTFRLSPNSRRSVRAQQALADHLETIRDFDVDEAACERLADNYAAWLKLYELDRERRLLLKLQAVQADKTMVLERLATALDFDWAKLINLREQRTELTLRLVNIDSEITGILKQYQLETATLDFSDFVDLTIISSRTSVASGSGEDFELAQSLATTVRELEVERAEQRRIFDFGQLRYQGPHDDLLNERISVGVGLQLDNSGSSRIRIRELELKTEALEEERNRKASAEATDFAERRQELQSALGYYEIVVTALETEAKDMDRIASLLGRKEGASPLPLLNIRERELRNQLRLIKLETELYEDYLELMQQSEELCRATGGDLLVNR